MVRAAGLPEFFMNIVLRSASVFALLASALAASAAVTVYTNRASFLAQLAMTTTETFTTDRGLGDGDNLYNGVDYRISNAFGAYTISRGVFNGEQSFGANPSDLDVVLPSAVNGFGADFGLANTGTGLRFSIGGQTVDLSDYLAEPGTGFFGVVSDQAFTPVDFQSAGQRRPSFSSEIYALDNLTYGVANPTPEPATFAALGLGAVAFVKRRKRA